MFQITEGKLKGLKAVSDANGVIRAAAMDQRGSLKKSLAAEKGVEPDQITYEQMSEFKSLVTKVLTQHSSAILLDPEFGLEATKARAADAGLLLAYENTGYDQTIEGRVPSLVPNWTVAKIKEAGGDCVKILLYYTPDEKPEVNEIKKAFVARVGSECAHYDIPYFLEFVGYDPNGGDEKGLEFAKIKPRVVAESMKEFSRPEYGVDVLKVEIPVNTAYIEGTKSFKGEGVAYSKEEALDHYRQTAEVSQKPFIYLSAGVSDDQFRENLELAGEAGTNFAGVLCGRATWKEGIPVYAKEGAEAFEAWLNDRGVQNITALNGVLENIAKPWYDKLGGLDQVQVVDKAGNPVEAAVA